MTLTAPPPYPPCRKWNLRAAYAGSCTQLALDPNLRTCPCTLPPLQEEELKSCIGRLRAAKERAEACATADERLRISAARSSQAKVLRRQEVGEP